MTETATPPTGTIDITNLVETVRSSFVTWGTAFAFSAIVAVPGFQWVGFPVISSLVKSAIEFVLNVISKASVMQAFFMNTAVRKASQAVDFIDAVAAKNNLPPTATDLEYENAEKAEMAAFRNFVLLTN